MTLEARVTQLEREVAELKGQVSAQPESITKIFTGLSRKGTSLRTDGNLQKP